MKKSIVKNILCMIISGSVSLCAFGSDALAAETIFVVEDSVSGNSHDEELFSDDQFADDEISDELISDDEVIEDPVTDETDDDDFYYFSPIPDVDDIETATDLSLESQSIPSFTSAANSVDVTVKGTYYTNTAVDILARINYVRREACENGYVFEGKKLTLDDYHALKWSSNLEEASRIRAMEASVYLSHTSPDFTGTYKYIDKTKFTAYAENLAWNNYASSESIVTGLAQFYKEKSDYLKYCNDSSKISLYGHYKNIIDPNMTHVGLAACNTGCAPSKWTTVAMCLGAASSSASVDETKDSSAGSLSATFGVSAAYLEKASLSGGKKTLGKGETTSFDMAASIVFPYKDKNYTHKCTIKSGASGMTWKSSKESVATVADTGVITAVSGGTAKITGYAGDPNTKGDYISSSVEIAVNVPLESIAFSEATLNIDKSVAATGNLNPVLTPADSTDASTIVYSSSNTNIITVDKNGKYTAKAPGTAKITATATSSTKGKLTASCDVKITAPLKGITLSAKTITLDYSGTKAPTKQLTIIYDPADTDSDTKVTWVSEDPTVATVSDKGLVTGVAGGSTTVTATVGTFSASCDVKVTVPISGFTVSDSSKLLYTTAETSTLSVTLTPLNTTHTNVTFKSSNTAVLMVSNAGAEQGEEVTIPATDGVATVTLHRGNESNKNAVLTITASGTSKTEKINVKIVVPSESITAYNGETSIAADSEVELLIGESIATHPEVKPDNAYDKKLIITSSDPGVVSVTSDGKITALSEGTATITYKNTCAPEPITFSFKVKVSVGINSMELNRNKITLYEGEDTADIKAFIYPEGVSTEEDIVWESMDEEVAKAAVSSSVKGVSSTATITPIGEGVTEIVATIGEFQRSCQVTVKASEVEEGDVPIEGDGKGIWIASQSFEAEKVYTGKKITQSDLRIYNNKTRLKLGTDYTISYKNNVNVADINNSKTPSMTITFKGQYSGKKTMYFAIKPYNIAYVTYDKMTTAVENGNKQRLIPELTLNGIKLKKNVDFIYEHIETMPGDFRDAGEYGVKIKGIGNFDGSETFNIAIVEKTKYLSKASVSVKPKEGSKFYYKEGGLTTDDMVVSVTCGGKIVSPESYSVIVDAEDSGKGYVTVAASSEGKEIGYRGSKTVTITVNADRTFSAKTIAVTEYLKEIMYNGGEATMEEGITQPETMTLKFGEDTLTLGTDYKVKYKNNRSVGKAEMIFTGKGRYTGSFKLQFKIIPKTAGLKVEVPETFTYTKGGVTPKVVVSYDDASEYVLEESDYTIKVLKNSNKKLGTMELEVRGKGNYKGYVKRDLKATIVASSLSVCKMTVPDKAYTSKGDGWKAEPKIYDTNGNLLTAGTDYNKTLIYGYKNDAEDSKSKTPAAGTVVMITAVGKGKYAGSSLTGSYHIYSKNIKNTVVVIDDQYYTGRKIEPGTSAIHVYANKDDAATKSPAKEIKADNYEIISYSNNLKSGTGKVVIKGKGIYGGKKTCSFTIKKKSY